jgi:hypothetical protein
MGMTWCQVEPIGGNDGVRSGSTGQPNGYSYHHLSVLLSVWGQVGSTHTEFRLSIYGMKARPSLRGYCFRAAF